MSRRARLAIAFLVAGCLISPKPAAAIAFRAVPRSKEAIRKTPRPRPIKRSEVHRGIETSITLLSLFTTRREGDVSRHEKDRQRGTDRAPQTRSNNRNW